MKESMGSNQQEDITQLVTVNKCLAMEKRQFHRQKLRVYSQKAVKLRAIMRQTTDPEQKKCLEAKLKNLQLKQDSQITKLARIDEIEKQLDEFVTEENEEIFSQYSAEPKKSKKQQSLSNYSQDTPAQRLRTKSSMPTHTHQDEASGGFSRKKHSFSKTKENEDLLLKDSRLALDELNGNKLAKSVSNNPSKQSVKSKEFKYQGIQQQEGNKISKVSKDSRQINGIRLSWNEPAFFSEEPIQYQGVPYAFSGLIEKVHKFWPDDIKSLVVYFKQSEGLKLKFAQKQTQFKNVMKKLQKLKQDEERLKKNQQATQKIEQRVQALIDKERELMTKIDKLQKNKKILQQQVDQSLAAIVNSNSIIVKSSLAFRENSDPVEVNLLHAEAVHKFTDQSFDSCQDRSNLFEELSNFQKGMQQYLLSAERAVMLISGEYQQVQSRLSKAKEESSGLQTKKRAMEQQLVKIDHSLSNRKSLMKQLEIGVHKLEEQMASHGVTADLKKSLTQELEQKCQKLKLKKRSLSERVKQAEEQLQSLTLKKEHIFDTILELEQKMVGMKTFEKQLQTKLIFCERDKENREEDIKLLQQKAEEMVKNIQESRKKYEEGSKEVEKKEKELESINQSIRQKMEEEKTMADRARKLQQQLAESTFLLEQQTTLAQKQTEQVNLKSAEHLEIESKIAQARSTLRSIQVSQQQWSKRVTEQKQKSIIQKKQLQQILLAKSDLENLLHDVIVKKELLLSEIEERSKELELLLNDLESAQEDCTHLMKQSQEIQTTIVHKKSELKDLEAECQQMRAELDEQLEQESNLVNRIAKLKEVQRTILLGIGVKGGAGYLDQELKQRVAEAVGELASFNNLKSSLKECKYQNRKLKLQNQRLSKLVEQS